MYGNRGAPILVHPQPGEIPPIMKKIKTYCRYYKWFGEPKLSKQLKYIIFNTLVVFGLSKPLTPYFIIH